MCINSLNISYENCVPLIEIKPETTIVLTYDKHHKCIIYLFSGDSIQIKKAIF